MSYVDAQLLQGEVVRFRARRSKALFTGPYLVGGLALLSAVAGFETSKRWVWWMALAWLVIAVLWYGGCAILYKSAEFSVTNKRVVIKVGWLRRRTLETMLSKVEGISVDQSIMGRMLNYGTIIVTGTGGTKEEFDQIAEPLEFRRQVQSAISAAEDVRAGVPAPAAAAISSADADRAERDCPYCAERILARAKVCKHCGRDVSGVAAS